jgi:hypothetical protein
MQQAADEYASSSEAVYKVELIIGTDQDSSIQ